MNGNPVFGHPCMPANHVSRDLLGRHDLDHGGGSEVIFGKLSERESTVNYGKEAPFVDAPPCGWHG